MKRTICIIVLLLFLTSLLFVICTHKRKHVYTEKNDTPSSMSEINKNKEEDSMRREFCKVDSVQKDVFVLKNTANEFYYIDNSYLGDFKTNDDVLLIYTDRTPMDNGGYAAEVYAIYHTNNALHYPANYSNSPQM